MNYQQEKAYDGAVKAENPLYELMRSYVQAKEAFDSACQSYAMAHQGRGAAEKTLLALSEKVSQVVQQGIHDPTAPQCPPPDVIGNGLSKGQATQARY